MRKLLLCLVIGLCSAAVSAEEIPFAGAVTGDNVNLRSGPDVNFEILGEVNTSDKLVVTGEQGKWYRVRPPSGISCYVHQNYIEADGAGGRGKGNQINIRSGAGERFSVLGQANDGDSVTLLGKKGEWYEIKPVKGTGVWVHSDFVKFYSKVEEYLAEEDVRMNSEKTLAQLEERYLTEIAKPAEEREMADLLSGYQEIIKYSAAGADRDKIAGRIRDIERLVTETELLKKTSALEEKVARLENPPEEILPPPTAAGTLEDLGRILNRPATHKLVLNGKATHYLKSQAVDLNKFVYQKVSVWGEVSQPEKSLLPVIEVTRINPAAD